MAAAQPNGTHQVRIDLARGEVTKQYRSWSRGEPAREWHALRLLARHAPGLAAAPVSARLDARPPVIVMSLLPGKSLGTAPVPAAQAAALARALDRLWRPGPASRLAGHGGIPANPVAFTRQVSAAVRAGHPLGDDPLVRRAYAAALRWLDRGAPDPAGCRAAGLVLGQGDSNLANFLWDGERVRLVDFEDCGPSDRAFELALLVEHISAWADGALAAGPFADQFSLTRAEQDRLTGFRRLAALFWLILLRPGGRSARRNPPGTQARQADRLLTLLG